MVSSLIAFALLTGSSATPPAASTKSGWDPNRMICEYDLQPGSRLARRKVCLTASQWEDWRREERLNLLRKQYNGAQ